MLGIGDSCMPRAFVLFVWDAFRNYLLGDWFDKFNIGCWKLLFSFSKGDSISGLSLVALIWHAR
jgi:hypothetical protein